MTLSGPRRCFVILRARAFAFGQLLPELKLKPEALGLVYSGALLPALRTGSVGIRSQTTQPGAQNTSIGQNLLFTSKFLRRSHRSEIPLHNLLFHRCERPIIATASSNVGHLSSLWAGK